VVTTTVAELLDRKGREVFTVDHEATCAEAAQKTIEHNVGSLLVVNEGRRPAEILGERDIVRKVAVKGFRWIAPGWGTT